LSYVEQCSKNALDQLKAKKAYVSTWYLCLDISQTVIHGRQVVHHEQMATRDLSTRKKACSNWTLFLVEKEEE